MIRLTSKIVAAYVGNNSVATSDLPELIRSTYTALIATSMPVTEPAERLQPAVSVRKSVTPDAILCLECGKPQKMMKRHLQTAHGLSVDEYRAKWSLPADYPMVAATYAARRSELAKSIGLGTRPRGNAETVSRLSAEPAAIDLAADEDAGGDSPKARHRYPASRWSKPAR